MLDHNELWQVRSQMFDLMAEVEKASHAPHGSYTYLCEWHGMVFFAHTPVGHVLKTFEPPGRVP